MNPGYRRRQNLGRHVTRGFCDITIFVRLGGCAGSRHNGTSKWSAPALTWAMEVVAMASNICGNKLVKNDNELANPVMPRRFDIEL